MKRLIILVGVVLFYVACKQNKLPSGVIDKKEMLNVMIDMQLTDAYLTQVYNPDTMRMQAHSRYNYIFSKYKIDSASFSNSLKYYSKDATELDAMYTMVSDSLTKLQESLKLNLERTGALRKAKNRTNDLSDYVLNNFKVEPPRFSNNLHYYTLNVKDLYRKFQSQDSLRHLQDSVNSEPKQTDKIQILKKSTNITNDLSTK